MKMPHILFFIAGPAPTRKESEAALEIGVVAMRNRSMISDTDNPEKCDGVAGEVIPAPYKDKPVIKSLAQAVALVRDKQRAENAAAAASLADPEVTADPAKESKAPGGDAGQGGAGGGKSQGGAGAGWSKNA